MIRKTIKFSVISLFLFNLIIPSAIAANLYRFTDDNGVKTMSRILPPSAAQKGYDILDSQTLRLIERVKPALTDDEIVTFELQQEKEKAAAEKAAIAEEKANKERQKQATYDKNLLASYSSEGALTRARDSEVNYRKDLIVKNTAKQKELDASLSLLQQKAADRELSGLKLSSNLKKRLSGNQRASNSNQQAIKDLEEEIVTLTKKFDGELARLQILRLQQKPTPSP